MPNFTPSYAKNIIGRSLRELVDPSLTPAEKKTVWAYFDSHCAYCGKSLVRGTKDAHLDHLVSAADGGSNQLSNQVLSCSRCNEKEKLDDPWEEFLDRKVQDLNTRRKRKKKIQDWQELHSSSDKIPSQEMVRLLEDASREVAELYSRKVDEIRRAVREEE